MIKRKPDCLEAKCKKVKGGPKLLHMLTFYVNAKTTNSSDLPCKAGAV